MSNQPPLFPGPDDGRDSFTTQPPALDRRSVQESMAEAAQRPLDFDPAARATFIRDHLRLIAQLIEEEKTETEIRTQCHDFAMTYPELFKKILAGEDITQLQSMLHMMDQMARGQMSHHQASMIVGTRLAERYLPHQFRPSQQAQQGGRNRR